jgi:hypothetical protein
LATSSFVVQFFISISLAFELCGKAINMKILILFVALLLCGCANSGGSWDRP